MYKFYNYTKYKIRRFLAIWFESLDYEYHEAKRAKETLHNAWTYLYVSYWKNASVRERGWLITPQQEALDTLHKLEKTALAYQLGLLK